MVSICRLLHLYTNNWLGCLMRNSHRETVGGHVRESATELVDYSPVDSKVTLGRPWEAKLSPGCSLRLLCFPLLDAAVSGCVCHGVNTV